MAFIAKLVEGYTGPGRIIVKFAGPLGDDDVTDAVRLVNIQHLQVMVDGTAAGATLSVEGSLDGALWTNLHDSEGADLLFNAVTIPRSDYVRECTMPYIRCKTVGGSGTSLVPIFIAQQGAVSG